MSKKRLKRIKNEYRTCSEPDDRPDGVAVALSSGNTSDDKSFEVRVCLGLALLARASAGETLWGDADERFAMARARPRRILTAPASRWGHNAPAHS